MTTKNGRPCKRCGGIERYKSGSCVACARDHARRWQGENEDRVRESKRRYQAANPEKRTEYNRRYYTKKPDVVNQWNAANPQKKAEANRKYRDKNPDKLRELQRRWYSANSDRVRDNSRRWRKNNPEKAKAKDVRRRTAKTKAGGSFTGAEWKALVKHQNGRCLACGKETNLTADHVVPVSKGGSSNISNIQGLCKSCNSSKGDKTIDYRKGDGFLRWIQRKILS